MIGGGGEKLTLRVVAQHADWWNLGGSAESYARKLDILRGHCEAVGRNYDDILKTWTTDTMIVANSEADARRIAEANTLISSFDDVTHYTPQQVTEQLQPLSDADIRLVGPDSSTALIFRDEYRKACNGELPPVNVSTVIEWLMSVDFESHDQKRSSHYGLLLHCTEQSFVPESAKQWQTLFAKLGLTLDIVNVGCCGMAGRACRRSGTKAYRRHGAPFLGRGHYQGRLRT